jgi:DNA gyrase subunit A
MQLRRLTALEVGKLREELGNVQADISDLLKILASDARRRKLVGRELQELVEEFGSLRRTTVLSANDVVVINDDPALLEVAPEEPLTDQSTLITLSTSGLLGRRSPDEEFNAKPGRHDVIARSLETSLYSSISAITDQGRLLTVRSREVPEIIRGSRGASVTEMFSLSRGERVVGLFGEGQGSVLIATRKGIAKRLELESVGRLRSGSAVINLKGDDRVVAGFIVSNDSEIVMVASDGQALRTPAAGISIQGPGAAGVSGMKLKAGAALVAAGLVEFGVVVLLVSDDGAVKVTDVAEVPTKGRATGGVRTVKWKNFETTASFAWVGRNQQMAAVVLEDGDSRKVDPNPFPLTIETSRRDGTTTDLDSRVLVVGEYRFQ